MKKILLILSLYMSSLNAQGLVEPKAEALPGQVTRVVLGKSVMIALQKFDKKFYLYSANDFIPSIVEIYKTEVKTSSIAAVVANLNGDKFKDVVVIGTNGTHERVLGVVSSPKGYIVYEMQKNSYIAPDKSFYPPLVEGDDEYNNRAIEREKGLTHYVSLREKKFKVGGQKLDVIQIEEFGGATLAYRFDKNKFIRITQ